MLSTCVNAFATVGLLLERLDEPRAAGARAEHAPGEREVPSILSLRFRRIAVVEGPTMLP